MKVRINQDECIGCGLCAETCPEVFCLNDDNVAEVCGEVEEEFEDAVTQAEEECPVNVIHTEE